MVLAGEALPVVVVEDCGRVGFNTLVELLTEPDELLGLFAQLAAVRSL